jgi:hypothetical protein
MSMLEMCKAIEGSSASLYQPAKLHPAFHGLDSPLRTI